MSIFNIYTLNTAEQPDIFFSNEGKLNLQRVKELLDLNKAPVGENGNITGEGFTDTQIISRNELPLIECNSFSLGSLGYFNEARYVNDSITTRRIQHQYYSKSSVLLTENSDFVIKFDFASEEGAKTKVKSLIESLGFEAIAFKIDDDLLRNIQNTYTWTAAKLEKIEKQGDSTKKVSYEIDPSDDQFQSAVDVEYKEHGKMSHITFELPYVAPNTPNTITVKLYSQGNRIVVEDNQIPDYQQYKNFMVYLMQTLSHLKNQ